MAREAVVEQLNDLLEVEGRGLAGRLNEVHSFVDWADAGTAAALRRIADRLRAHQRQLTDAIVRLGGVPRPRTPDMATARVHYLNLRYLLPFLIDNTRDRVRAYTRATTNVSTEPLASDTVNRILSQHQADLEQLEALANQVTPSAPTRQTPAVTDHDA